MKHQDTEKRLKTVEGHIAGIRRMVGEGDGLVLYSVGEDGDDDGGDGKGLWMSGSPPDGDVIFCLGDAYRERRLRPAEEAAERRRQRPGNLRPAPPVPD